MRGDATSAQERCAPARRSSILAPVQAPMIGHVDRRVFMAGAAHPRPARWPGCAAAATWGARVDRIEHVLLRVAGAPSSVRQCDRSPKALTSTPCCGATRSKVVASGATRPACAPSSALILARVMRSFIESARTASPQKLQGLVGATVHAEAADHVTASCPWRSRQALRLTATSPVKMVSRHAAARSRTGHHHTEHLGGCRCQTYRQPNAPPVGECESPPTQNMPGRIWPCCGSDHMADALAVIAHGASRCVGAPSRGRCARCDAILRRRSGT